jgi:PTS system cellobiose-specific IIB component
MINVMFVCSAGMSTSLLVEKVKKEAAANGVEMNIYALGESEAKKDLKQAEVLLLGPQVRYLESTFKKELAGSDVKLGVVDMKSYGMMDGKKVYKQISDLLGE